MLLIKQRLSVDRQSLILKVFIIVTIAIAITYIGYQSGDDSKGRHPEEEMEVSIEPGMRRGD